MYTRNKLPNVSHAACPSQHATPLAIVPRVHVVPPSVEYARKMLLSPDSFEVATTLFGFVGSTFTKLSAWLPVVALTLMTGSRQVRAENSSNGLGARSFGFIHFRVPSGTSIPSVAVTSCACGNGAGENSARIAKRI